MISAIGSTRTSLNQRPVSIPHRLNRASFSARIVSFSLEMLQCEAWPHGEEAIMDYSYACEGAMSKDQMPCG